MSAGKVDIGAFRTYPDGYRPPEDAPSEYQSISLAKIEDFGVHCKRYYPLDVTFFKSQLDAHILTALWNSYWITTLSSSPLFSNVEFINNQISDINQKLSAVERKLLVNERSTEGQEALLKIVTDAKAVGDELEAGRISHFVKQMLFARRFSWKCAKPQHSPLLKLLVQNVPTTVLRRPGIDPVAVKVAFNNLVIILHIVTILERIFAPSRHHLVTFCPSLPESSMGSCSDSMRKSRWFTVQDSLKMISIWQRCEKPAETSKLPS